MKDFNYEYAYGIHIYYFKSCHGLKYEVLFEDLKNGRGYEISLIPIHIPNKIFLDIELKNKIFECILDFWKIRPNRNLMFKLTVDAENHEARVRKFTSWLNDYRSLLDFNPNKIINVGEDIQIIFEFRKK